jgi:protein TonB
MARRRNGGSGIYAISVLLHAGVALAVVGIEKPTVHEATSVTVREVKRAQPKHVDAPPPPPPVQAPKPVRKVPRAPAPPPIAAPAPVPTAEAPAAPKVADFGLSMSGAVGAGAVAVPTGPTTRVAPREIKSAAPKALVPGKPQLPKGEDACIEALIKPKPIATPQPAYADRAREAGIQGKVRVELTVDETGAVVSARVLESLGYGLDEAALEAAKTWRFEPATRCGKTTATTFVVGIRFTL